jgi:hypothetical protein
VVLAAMNQEDMSTTMFPISGRSHKNDDTTDQITEDGHLEDTASEWEEEDEKEYIPINSETGKITKYKILRITKDLVVVKTKYWVKEECEEKGMCIIRHYVLALEVPPQEEDQTLTLWKCQREQCGWAEPHTHTTLDGAAHNFNFQEIQTSDDRQNNIGMKYVIHHEEGNFVYIKTHFWQKSVQERAMMTFFTPDQKMQPTFEIVGLYKCERDDCVCAEWEHTHGVPGEHMHNIYRQEWRKLPTIESDDSVNFIVTKVNGKNHTITSSLWEMEPKTFGDKSLGAVAKFVM